MLAAQYNWTVEQIGDLSWFQIKSLTKELARRTFIDRKVFADCTRAAHHADRSEYDRFIASMNPDTIQTETEDAPLFLPGDSSGFNFAEDL